MSDRKTAKAKVRKKQLAKRKHLTGSITNGNNALPVTYDGRYVMAGTVSGNMATDLLEETNTNLVTPESIKELKAEWIRIVEHFKTGTKERVHHAFFAEHVYLGKMLLKITKEELLTGDTEKDMNLKLIFALLEDNFEDLEKILIQFYNQVLDGKSLYLVNSIEFNQLRACYTYNEVLGTLLEYTDVGLFQRAVRYTIRDMQSKDRSNPVLKYYRVREGYELLNEIKGRKIKTVKTPVNSTVTVH